MKLLQTTLRLILIAHFLFLSSPASFLGLSQKSLSVRLYIDEADQDEDVFIEVGDHKQEPVIRFHDESRRDTGKSLKTLVKRPLKWVPSVVTRVLITISSQLPQVESDNTLFQDRSRNIFHPPPSELTV